MRRLLDWLADSGHIVIIDAPPLLPVTDGAVLTAAADGALVVVTAGRTLDTQLGAALASLHAVKGHTLGVVLNRVAPKATDGGYYGGYYGTAKPAKGARAREGCQVRHRRHARGPGARRGHGARGGASGASGPAGPLEQVDGREGQTLDRAGRLHPPLSRPGARAASVRAAGAASAGAPQRAPLAA